VPEGLTVAGTAKLLDASTLKNFSKSEFIALATPQEGRLFPDTYFIPPMANAAQILKLFEANFEHQLRAKQYAIIASGRKLDEIINLASLVEKEASDFATRRLIAGILWKRLDANMPLQVDVAIKTYKEKGLPPAPIVSPSLEAITAAIDPEPSDFWFFLSGQDGAMHYAKTFAEHKKNIAHYL